MKGKGMVVVLWLGLFEENYSSHIGVDNPWQPTIY